MKEQKMNELEMLVVADILDREGKVGYSLRKGNGCVWASYGIINEYFIFRDGVLVDRQVD